MKVDEREEKPTEKIKEFLIKNSLWGYLSMVVSGLKWPKLGPLMR